MTQHNTRKAYLMDNKLLLAKSAVLLYRESQLPDGTDSSADLVKTVLESVQVSDIGIGINSDREVIMAVKATILEMCNTPQDEAYSAADLLHRFKLNCGNDDKYYEALKQGIEDEMTEPGMKRSVVSIRRAINNHFKESTLGDVLNKSSQKFKFSRDKIDNVDQFIAEVISQLEPLQMSLGAKDTAIIGEVDIGDDEAMNHVFNNIDKMNKGDRIYKTGWPEVNDMLQGGFRPSEEWVLGGLMHKYKTGFNLSLFAQIALFNKPHTVDPTKKPLLLRISFEDELVSNLQFLYQYLKHSETGEDVDVKTVSSLEMRTYVKESLEVNGFHVKMLRVDPSLWTYKSLCNKIIQYESEGYAVEVVFVDYLYKLPMTGCSDGGVAGGMILDMFSRVRNFFSAKDILFVTPHQLSTEAQALLRGGMPEENFVKEIASRGYFEASKGLGRIYDGCLLIHLFKHNKKWFFSIQLDKHRFPLVVDDEKKYVIYEMPPRSMPIPHSPNEYKGFRKLKDAQPSNADADLFKLG